MDSETLVERATSLIHQDILTGTLAPRGKLRVRELAARYSIGSTPIREALSRLAPNGLVQAIGNRGFRVTSLTRDDLIDILMTRRLAETAALRLSMARGGDEWEARVVAAFHTLQRAVERCPERSLGSDLTFERVHKGLHTALLAGCGAPRLLALHDHLYDQSFRYRAIVRVAAEQPEDFIQKHQELVDAVLGGDADQAASCLDRHISLTLSAVYPQTSEPD